MSIKDNPQEWYVSKIVYGAPYNLPVLTKNTTFTSPYEHLSFNKKESELFDSYMRLKLNDNWVPPRKSTPTSRKMSKYRGLHNKINAIYKIDTFIEK